MGIAENRRDLEGGLLEVDRCLMGVGRDVAQEGKNFLPHILTSVLNASWFKSPVYLNFFK